MESLKVMEKFDGGNFHLWKFKMHMMLSKHGFWKFVDGSATLPSEEIARADCNEKEMNISQMPNLHTFNIVTMRKVRGRLFVMCMKLRQLATSYSFKGDSSPSKCKKETTCLCTSTR